MNRIDDEPFCFLGPIPVADSHPLTRLQILVVLEKVFNLLHCYIWQIRVLNNVIVSFRQSLGRYRYHLFILARVVLHDKDTDRANVYDASWHEFTSVDNQDVDRVTVLG